VLLLLLLLLRLLLLVVVAAAAVHVLVLLAVVPGSSRGRGRGVGRAVLLYIIVVVVVYAMVVVVVVVVAMVRLVMVVRLVVAAPLVEQLPLLLLLHQLGQLAGRRTTVGGVGLVRLLLHCILLRFRLHHLLLDAALGIQECACDPNVSSGDWGEEEVNRKCEIENQRLNKGCYWFHSAASILMFKCGTCVCFNLWSILRC